MDRFRRHLPSPIRQAVKPGTGQEILPFASGLAFYALVSLPPLVIFSMWAVAQVLPDERVRSLGQTLGEILPPNLGADRALLRVAELGTSLGVASVLGALWPASAYGAGLRRAFVRLSPTGREHHPGLRGRGLVLLVILPLFVLGSLVGALALTGLFSDGAIRILGWIVALAVAFAVAWVALVAIYRIFPPDPPAWRRIILAATFTAAGVAVMSLAFAVLASGADFEKRYAVSGLAAVVAVGLWLFWANALVLVGYRAARAAR